MTDPDPSTNTSFVSTSLTTTVDVGVTKSVSAASIAPGDTVTYTITFTNAGPSYADGSQILDNLNTGNGGTQFGGYSTSIVSCTTTGGAVCPTLAGVTSTSGNDYPINTTIPVFPGGSAVTIVYTAAFTVGDPSGCSTSANPNVYNYGRIDAPISVTDTNFANTTVNLFTPANVRQCPQVDVGVTKSVDRSPIAPGDSANYTVTFTNTGPGAADGSSIYDNLNTYNAGSAMAGFDALFTSCTTTGGAVCPTLVDVHTASQSDTLLQASIATFPANSSITVTYAVTFRVGDPQRLLHRHPAQRVQLRPDRPARQRCGYQRFQHHRQPVHPRRRAPVPAGRRRSQQNRGPGQHRPWAIPRPTPSPSPTPGPVQPTVPPYSIPSTSTTAAAPSAGPAQRSPVAAPPAARSVPPH